LGETGENGGEAEAAMESVRGGCIFCEIARGSRKSALVFEDAQTLAFLDHRPLFPGHCLLIPKDHHESLFDLPGGLVEPFFANVQLLTRAVQQGMRADGILVAMNNRVSQSVPHLHAHVVPRRRGDGLKGFFWPRHDYSDEAAARVAQDAIKAAIDALRSGAGSGS
jgi:histidine triad (HIT) family protein